MSAATSNAIFYPNLPLSVIIESAHNPRKRFDPAKLAELAENIRERGIDVPVTVREVETPSGTRFELAAGHRRCRAARLAGLTEVPALIRTLSDREFLEVLHIDNLQREGLDPLDEALGYEQLLAEGGYDTSTLATKIGRSLTYVLSRVRLLSLGTAGREALARGYLPLSHAIEIAKLPEAVQRTVLEDEFNLAVGALEVADQPSDETEAAAPEADDDQDDDAAGDVVDAEFIDDVLPEDRFAFSKWAQPIVPTLAELRHMLKTRVYRRLNVVPWQLDDDVLLPEAGACAKCSKRSGAEPLLFAELDAGTDACLDGVCYSAKHKAFELVQLTTKDREPQLPTPDADEERFERMREQQEQRQKAEKQRIKEVEAAQRGRDAVVSAIVLGASNTRAWLAALIIAFAARIGSGPLFALVERLCIPIEDSESPSVPEMNEAIRNWAYIASSDEAAKALTILALGHELFIQQYGSSAAPNVELFAHVANIDAEEIAKAAAKTKAAKSSAPKKDKPARATRQPAGVQ